MGKFKLDQSISLLQKTPAVLKELLSGLEDKWVKENEGENTWSAFDVVGHLIHGEKTDWVMRIKIILNQQDDKTFKPFDRYAMFEDSKGKNMDQLLFEFEVLRHKNLQYLKSLNLTKEDFKKTGIHPDFGTVTLQQLIATWTVHDLNHLYQISRVLAKQYKPEVGPWVEYLRVLKE